MCQRAKSPRKVREKVPAPKPPTGAPCQKPLSICWASSVGFLVPGFSRGAPMGRFQAALGMSSLLERARGTNARPDIRIQATENRLNIETPRQKEWSGETVLTETGPA